MTASNIWPVTGQLPESAAKPVPASAMHSAMTTTGTPGGSSTCKKTGLRGFTPLSEIDRPPSRFDKRRRALSSMIVVRFADLARQLARCMQSRSVGVHRLDRYLRLSRSADLTLFAWHAACKSSGNKHSCPHTEDNAMTQKQNDRDQQGREDARDRQERIEQSQRDQARQDPDPQHRKEQDRNPQDRRG